MSHERRHYVRVAFDAPARLAVSGHGTFEVRVLDVSLQGALLELPPDLALPQGTPCALSIPLMTGPEQIAMSGELAHLDGACAGLQGHTIDLDSVTHLRRVIELQLGDPALLERDLQTLVSAHRGRSVPVQPAMGH
ncbi:PilZ domain-containing protein [Acidovorax sp. GBBC 3334]|uniref:Cyclic diguanosine monophosphate-binding protein n=1 Tax=Paracidovorax konjaci TaxID=32040 RepID=A0A1I1U0E3_9BURK|nr:MULTISPECIES: PilZ domain-containing protein [Comamonadaceae]MDA8453276.1 PilZ domain-containing protein [Acidovorax sp. GBBC 3334]MDA8520685.1 PilZ domain-containing protein [Acidovorax sp. NCPPB 4044]SFD64326.1 PilZ domain-containing protein [Paracidovorax konjaci]